MTQSKIPRSNPIFFLIFSSISLWLMSCAADVSPYGRNLPQGPNMVAQLNIAEQDAQSETGPDSSSENPQADSLSSSKKKAQSPLEELKLKAIQAVNEYQDSLFTQLSTQLDSALKVDSLDAELWYIAGYLYDRSVVSHGGQMEKYSLKTLNQISAYFEKVIALESNYSGRIILLPPRQKILSTWGSMAMVYQSQSKLDSMQWVFEQAKNKGGVTPYMEDFGKHFLNQLPKNAIVFDNADLMTFLYMYLQSMYEVRLDVDVVNLPMLAAEFSWNYHRSKVGYSKGFPVSLDSQYVVWEAPSFQLRSGPINIQELSSNHKEGLLFSFQNRALSIISQNEGERPLCWNPFMVESAYVGASQYLNRYTWHKCLMDEASNPKEMDWSYQLENFDPLIPSHRIMIVQQGGEYLRAAYAYIEEHPKMAQGLVNSFKNDFYPKYDDKAQKDIDFYVNKYQELIDEKLNPTSNESEKVKKGGE